MTTQDIFDTVATHLLTQGRRSKKEHGSACLYRGPEGRKCAVGCLIDDAHYLPTFEGRSVATARVWRALELSGIPHTDDTRVLLGRLQQVHDSHCVDDWRARLQDVATSFHLTPEVLYELDTN